MINSLFNLSRFIELYWIQLTKAVFKCIVFFCDLRGYAASERDLQKITGHCDAGLFLSMRISLPALINTARLK